VVKILFQTSGTSAFEQDGRRIIVSPGDCLAYDVSRPHVIVSSAATKHDVIIAPKELVQRRGLPIGRAGARLISARTGAAHLAHNCVLSTLDEVSKFSPDCEFGIAEALLDLILLPFLCGIGTELGLSCPEVLKRRAKAFIQQNLRDPELDIDGVAAALGCTKRYLHMLFVDEATSLSRHIWQARLEMCRQELEASQSRSVTNIAFSWGFNSSSHFSRLFKNRYGFSPSAIRNSTSPRADGPVPGRTEL
jgi:AraC-like DNA-binding protein